MTSAPGATVTGSPKLIFAIVMVAPVASAGALVAGGVALEGSEVVALEVAVAVPVSASVVVVLDLLPHAATARGQAHGRAQHPDLLHRVP